MVRAFRTLRKAGSNAKKRLLPKPEVAAWRYACRRAERIPRFTSGEIKLLNYQLRYSDLLTICPQWDDLFVRQALRFDFKGSSPRIIDCGANIGLSSLYFKRLYPGARIKAYEADPDIHAILSENLRRNGASDVDCVNAAVWIQNGRINFLCEGADSGTLTELAGDLNGTDRSVPSVRLRDILAEENVDLLKIDIEGAEREVLMDCASVLGNVRAMLLDLHDFAPRQRNIPAILNLLEQEGFMYTLDELRLLPWRPPVAGEESPFRGHALCWALLVRAWRA